MNLGTSLYTNGLVFLFDEKKNKNLDDSFVVDQLLKSSDETKEIWEQFKKAYENKDSIKLDSFVFYQNSDPVSNDIDSAVSEDGSVIIDLLAQASDIDGDTLSVQITNPTNGTAELIGNGRIKYTPNQNWEEILL